MRRYAEFMGNWGRAGLVVLALAAFGAWRLKEAGDERAEREAARKADEDTIRITASLDDACSAERPLAITVTNGSARTLKSATYHLAIYAEGQSDDLNGERASEDRWPVVVEPGKTVVRCRSVPVELPRGKYYFKVEKRWWTSPPVFYGAGEFIPLSAESDPSPSSPSSAPGPRGARPASSRSPSR